MNEIKELFRKYQQPLLKLVNHPFGRKYLGISQEVDGKIDGLTDNAYGFRLGQNKYRAVFRTYPLFAKKLGLALRFGDSLAEGIKYYFHPSQISLINNFLNPSPAFLTMGLTFGPAYSNAGGDGGVLNESVNPWATCRSAASGNALRATNTETYLGTQARAGGAYDVKRGYFPIDFTSLTALTASAASLSLYCINQILNEADKMSLILTTQTDPTSLALGDFSQLTLNSPTEGVATRMDLTNSQYNAFNCNAAALVWCAAAVGGYLKLGVRSGKDIDNVAPAGTNEIDWQIRFSDYTGTSQDPKFDMTYTLTPPAAGNLIFI